MKSLPILFIFICTTLLGQVVTIPDTKFLQALTIAGVDKNNDGLIQTSEAQIPTHLDLSYSTGFSDATGIEAFTNLDTLNVSSNQLTSINITSLTKLTALFCHINKLTSIDISQNTKLKYLFVGNNKLTSLDVSNCTNLIHLECAFNKITALGLGTNTVLSVLECTSNKIAALDVSTNTDLKTIYCNVNSITGLDFTNCKNIETIDCGYNALTSLYTTGCTKLNRLVCYNNKLTNLDLTTNTLLTSLDIGKNYYATLDLSKNTILNSIDCADSPNLTYVCVIDSAAYNSNPTNYFKDAATTFVQKCSLLTAVAPNLNTEPLVEIYPNPSSNSFKLTATKSSTICIINSMGIPIDTFTNPLPLTFGETYPSGVYLIQLQINDQIRHLKIIKE